MKTAFRKILGTICWGYQNSAKRGVTGASNWLSMSIVEGISSKLASRGITGARSLNIGVSAGKSSKEAEAGISGVSRPTNEL